MRIGIEVESEESARLKHLAHWEEASTRESSALESIRSGVVGSEIFKELSDAIKARTDVVVDRMPRERAFIIGSKRFALPPLLTD